MADTGGFTEDGYTRIKPASDMFLFYESVDKYTGQRVEKTIIFTWFPEKFSMSARANYKEHNTNGMMPLMYANRTGKKMKIPELLLDNSEKNESVMPQADELFELLEETRNGTPPLLTFTWGNRRSTLVVLTGLDIEVECFYADYDEPVRAVVNLELEQIQGEAGRYERDFESGHITKQVGSK